MKRKKNKCSWHDVMAMARSIENDMGRLLAEDGLVVYRAMSYDERLAVKSSYLERVDDFLSHAVMVPQSVSLRESIRSLERYREALVHSEV